MATAGEKQVAGGIDDASLALLEKYSACDVSDALLKLKVPGAGHIPDVYPRHRSQAAAAAGDEPGQVTIAPASTVLFVRKGETPDSPPRNIPQDAHWADLTKPGTIVVLKQPDGQKNAVCGGIMALRMKVCHAQGIVVLGRARDVEELRSADLPIYARGLSTIGSGASSTPWATQVPVAVDDETTVHPGDVVVLDPTNGVVVIPRDRLPQVLELLPRLVAADDKVKHAVLGGEPVFDAFREHRRGL